MNKITALEAAQIVGPYINLCADNEEQQKKIFDTLSLIQWKAWKMGTFKGFVKDFNVNTRTRNINGVDRTFIITPHNFEILKGINLDGKPAKIRDAYFQFNSEGNGSMTNCVSCNWTDDVIDLGEEPVLFQPCENKCSCGNYDCNSRNIGVVSYICDKTCEINKEEVLISGINSLDNPVVTYRPKSVYAESHNLCHCISPTTQSKNREVVHGDLYPIKNKLVIHTNIKWKRIDSIRKDYSTYPVEVFAICGNEAELLARLEPNQTSSNYRIYELPGCCREYECVHGLFKIGKPDKIVSPTQMMIIDDEEALIALSKSMELTYNKEEIEKGELFLVKGMATLDDEAKQNRSNTRTPLIVEGNSEENEYLGGW